MNVERRRLLLDGGVESTVEVVGHGPAIVLLHGFTGDASTMQVLTERLAPSHTVVVPNLIGHGGSTGPDDHYSVDAMAAQVVEIVAALGFPAPIDLVGYSMGGRVALTLACRFPAQVASLTLVGASAGLATAEEQAERRAADEALAASILTDGLGSFVDRWMANPLFATQSRLGADFLAAARAQRMANSPEELARSLLGAGTGTMRPLHDLLATCAMPVSLVVGADDAKFRDIAASLAGSLPAARVATIDDAGHAAHLEQPDAVVAEIEAAVSRATVGVFPISIALRGDHTTGRGTTRRRDSALVALRADGHTGWGEASPLPGWSSDDMDAALATLRSGSPLAIDGSAWEAVGAWLAAAENAASARAAIAGAALDLDARRAGVPLWHHLAERHPSLDVGGARSSPRVNALVSATPVDDVAAGVRAAISTGTTTVKLKVGALDPGADLERIAAARAAGPEVTLRLDANGAWDHDTAVDVLRRALAFGVELCEEPVSGVAEIAAVGREVEIGVAVDESLRGPGDLAVVIGHAGDLAALIVKPQALGGPDRAIDTVVAARAAGIGVIVTSMIDSAVGLAHAAHVAAACGLATAHGLATASLLSADVAAGLAVIDGHIVLGDEVGLGIGPVSPHPARPS